MPEMYEDKWFSTENHIIGQQKKNRRIGFTENLPTSVG